MERNVLAFSLISITLFYFFSSNAIAARDAHSVIVIGAGMSGISAAKTLSDAGIKDILILEATDRIGGRMHKTNFTGLNVEIGANWVEGVGGSKLNPIWDMVNKQIKLKTFISNFDNVTANIYKQSGGVYEKFVAQKAYDLASEVKEYSKKVSTSLSAHRQDDISLLASQRLNHHVPSTPLEMAIDYYNYDFQLAEPPRVTSLQNTEPNPTFSNFGEDLYFVADPRGYENVVHYLAPQFLTTDKKTGRINDRRLLFKKVAREIRYSKSGVIVKTEDGSVYRAGYVMVSASIGVLQSKLINFQPDLPQWKIVAMYQLDMAVYTKIFLKFPFKFWPSGNGTEFFLYASEKRGYYPIWQQLEAEYPGANVLLVTVTDDESRRIEQQSDSETKAEAMAVLQNMFGKNIPKATEILVPRWWSNRFYKGTFSNWPIGISRFEFDQIRAPVGRVYFTGEHTSESYNGYVHGAYLAGIDSANLMIKCVKKRMCTYQIQPKGT